MFEKRGIRVATDPAAACNENHDRIWQRSEGELGKTMKTLARKLTDAHGQGLVEYMLVVFLVAFVFWVAIKDTTVGGALGDLWSRVSTCVATPFSCGAG